MPCCAFFGLPKLKILRGKWGANKAIIPLNANKPNSLKNSREASKLLPKWTNGSMDKNLMNCFSVWDYFKFTILGIAITKTHR